MKPAQHLPRKSSSPNRESGGEAQRWLSFAARRAQAVPLRFAAGFRHTVRKGVCCKKHSHAALEIVFHRAGSGVTRVRNAEVLPFGEHSVVIYGPDVLHDQVMTTPGEDVCVQIELPRSERARLASVHCLPKLSDLILMEEIVSLSESAFSDNPVTQAILNHRATAVLLALLPKEPRSAPALAVSPAAQHAQKAEEYIRRHFQSIGSLREVADQVGVSMDHLRHVFRTEKKVSLVGFLTALRIRQAKYLLRNSGLALKQIADLSGFSNEYYFSSVFRRQTAQSPAAYRRQIPADG